MTTLDIAHQRLHNQHLSHPDFATPADVVRWFGAVQAQDFMGSLYAIGLRMPPATSTEQTVEQAIAGRTIVRTWPMRGTIHFIPPEDARWMLKLLAHRRVVGVTGMYRKVGLTDEIFARAGEVLAKALQGGKQLTRKELYQAMSEAGIATSDVTGTARQLRGLHILGYWSQEGLICLGPRRGKQHTFTLLDEWVPNSPLLEGDEALAVLARRYFVSHGPATVYDFAWWTGLTITEARLGLKFVEHDFAQETVDGKTYWYSITSSTPPPTPRPAPTAYLLPPYDEFTVAYKDRSAFLDPTLTKEESLHGIGSTVIVDGRMAGTWKRALMKKEVIVSVNLFSPLTPSQIAAISTAADRCGNFLNLPAVVDVINLP